MIKNYIRLFAVVIFADLCWMAQDHDAWILAIPFALIAAFLAMNVVERMRVDE